MSISVLRLKEQNYILCLLPNKYWCHFLQITQFLSSKNLEDIILIKLLTVEL